MSSEVDAYRELFERSADAILIIEGETFIDCNQATVEMLRYGDKQELLRTHPSELSPPKQPDGRDSYEKANEMIATAFEHGSHRFEWDHMRADGEVFPVEVLLTAVQEPGRRVLHVVWRDITDRKQLEHQVRHAQKMEAIGKLVGGIAHDFNNLLVAINANAGLLGRRLADDPEVMQMVRQIMLAGDRAAGLVRQLLAFGRKQELVPAAHEVNELVGTVRGLLDRIIGERIDLELIRSEHPLFVEVDVGQIEQVLMNLATNARDAMPDGGTVTLSVGRADFSEPTQCGNEMLAPGAYAVVAVADVGTGMSPEITARAVEPFFTTKETGKGTGLGLATSYGIVKQSGGALVIFSTPGHGTTVKVYLPLRDRPAVAPAPPRELPQPIGGSETVLVVEDEKLVADVVVTLLRDNGYQVIEACNGVEALEIYLREHESIDLVVSDVVMPKLGGPEWVTRARAAGHEPRVLFMSGYTQNALAALREEDRSVNLIEKPFAPGELCRRVRQVLDDAD